MRPWLCQTAAFDSIASVLSKSPLEALLPACLTSQPKLQLQGSNVGHEIVQKLVWEGNFCRVITERDFVLLYQLGRHHPYLCHAGVFADAIVAAFDSVGKNKSVRKAVMG